MLREQLKIGVDVDDVLYDCNRHAVERLNRERNEQTLSIYDINDWGELGGLADERLAYFSDPVFVEGQPILAGAQAFIHELSKRGEVFFITAVSPACMSARAERLIRDFPEVPPRNILIAARKDLVKLDLLLDDGAHNILGSAATYPVLFRRPWNNHLTGLLAVNGYDDFLRLVDRLAHPFPTGSFCLNNGGVLCLIGPSGSGKTELARALLKDPRFDKPVTTTTRRPRSGETGKYHFLDRRSFELNAEAGAFLESTVYGGEYYGAAREAVDRCVDAGRIAVMPVDICGGISLKNAYPDTCMLLFVKRPRSAVINAILDKDCPRQEKILRLLGLDAEYRNEAVCDETLRVTGEPIDALPSLMALLAAV